MQYRYIIDTTKNRVGALRYKGLIFLKIAPNNGRLDQKQSWLGDALKKACVYDDIP